MKFSLVVLLLVLSSQLFALVSIKPVDVGEKAGFSGGVELGLDTKRGNTEKDTYKASAKITYDNNVSYVAWAQVSGEYAESSGVEDTNKKYAHLRFIHKLSKDVFRYEIFGQVQEDKFKALKQRRLGGAGIRAKIFNTPIGGEGYFGLGAMYEDIRYTDPSIDPNEYNTRLNTYLAYSLKFMDSSSLAYTLYYQPLFEEMSDYVMTNDLELKLQIYKKLFLKFGLSYDLDSRPPNGVAEKYDLSQSTTFVYEF
jgi:putative salt-induced outer membrane protein YdiY